MDVSSASAGPPATWPDLLPQHDKDLLQWVAPLKGGTLATCYLRDVASALQLRRADDGTLLRELPMPGIGSVGGFSGNHRHSEFFFSFVGFTEPGAMYRCARWHSAPVECACGGGTPCPTSSHPAAPSCPCRSRCDAADPAAAPSLFRRIQTKGFSPDDFLTEQVQTTLECSPLVWLTCCACTHVPLLGGRGFPGAAGAHPHLLTAGCCHVAAAFLQVFAKSRDGTRVPMFVVHRRGLPMDGRNPTLLYGYGGFNISLEPGFSVARLCWLLAYGGAVAVANLRGGGEYGTEWRDAGSSANKQNVFDDFQACAEHLHAAGYCSPDTLAIQASCRSKLCSCGAARTAAQPRRQRAGSADPAGRESPRHPPAPPTPPT